MYHSLNIVSVIKSRRLKRTGHVARVAECRSAFKILTGKLTGKRTLGRIRCRWDDNIKIYSKEIVVNTRNWIDSAQYMDC